MLISILLIIVFPLCLDPTNGVFTAMHVLPYLMPTTSDIDFYLQISAETEILLDFYSIIAR